MRVWYVSLVFVFVAIIQVSAQDEWDWGWSKDITAKPYLSYYEKAVSSRRHIKSAYSKLIWFYRTELSLKQGPRCPCFPSCSTYTLYSMNKYGFLWGLLMGIERIYFRENPDLKDRLHYVSIWIKGKEKVYDPPEANFIFGKKDWRIINPDYFHLFFGK